MHGRPARRERAGIGVLKGASGIPGARGKTQDGSLVKYDGAGHDGNDGVPDAESAIGVPQARHEPRSGIQPKGAAPGEQQGIDPIHCLLIRLSMTYKMRILENAQQDLDWFRRNDKTSYIKCFDLVREMMTDPRNGTGKPERLRYFDQEVYSRRVNHKDRLIYTIYESVQEVDISSCRGHYE